MFGMQDVERAWLVLLSAVRQQANASARGAARTTSRFKNTGRPEDHPGTARWHRSDEPGAKDQPGTAAGRAGHEDGGRPATAIREFAKNCRGRTATNRSPRCSAEPSPGSTGDCRYAATIAETAGEHPG
jgi:hypothetical protein